MIFDHIGIFVSCLEKGRDILSKQYKIIEISDEIVDPLIDVKIRFLKDSSDIKYELIAPLSSNSPVWGSLLNKKNLLNHLGYRTTNFNCQIKELRSVGCLPIIPPTPAVAFNGKSVIFMLSPLNYIIELIED
ncbi:VOC family protein [Planktomarina temperata]|nr:VOC family protein [Planktomarina temperata]